MSALYSLRMAIAGAAFLIAGAIPGLALDSGVRFNPIAAGNGLVQEAALDWRVTGGGRSLAAQDAAATMRPFNMAALDWRVVG